MNLVKRVPFKKTLYFIIFFVISTNYAKSLKTPNTILSTVLTIYKNGAILSQGQTFPLSKGKIINRITGIAKSIQKESLTFYLSAQPKEAFIEESILKKSDDETLLLDLLVNSDVHESKSFINLTYLLGEVGWSPNYVIQFKSGYQYLFFNGSIEINNNSGVNFKNTRIQLVDGNIPSPKDSNSFKNQQKPKGYDYNNLIDIDHNEPKRLNWVSSKDTMEAKREYRISVGGEYLKDMEGISVVPVIETWVSFENSLDNHLGHDLPCGPAVIYYQDEQGRLEILGTTQLKHARVGEKISLRIPLNQIEKIEKDHKKESECIQIKLDQNQFLAASNTAQYTLTLVNSSEKSIEIRVTLDLPAGIETCKILRSTIPPVVGYSKSQSEQDLNNSSICWDLVVPPNGKEIQLKYQLSFTKTTKE